MAKRDRLISFRAEEEFEAWLMRAFFNLDMTRSEFIREVLLDGYPSFKARREQELEEDHTRYEV